MLFGTNLLAQSLLNKWSQAQAQQNEVERWNSAVTALQNWPKTDKTIAAQLQFDSQV